MKNYIFFFFIIAFVFSCDNDDKSSLNKSKNRGFSIYKSRKQVIRNIAYGDARRQLFDAYLPKDRDNKTKAIIMIPGGGWIGGDKACFEWQANVFADSSIAAFVVNYRYTDTIPKVTYVDVLNDIDKAIEYIVSKSDEYYFESDNICIFGHSAGGHLALLYAYRNNRKKRINSVVSVAGVSDITESKRHYMSGINFKPIFDILVGSNDIEKWQDASPINHINNITTHLYHGKLDRIIPYEQSEILFEKIKKLNPNNKYVLFEEDYHGLNMTDFTSVVHETISLVTEQDNSM